MLFSVTKLKNRIVNGYHPPLMGKDQSSPSRDFKTGELSCPVVESAR